MSLASKETTAAATHAAVGSRTVGRRRRRVSGHRGTRRGATVQPLYEALSVGLGCDATGYRLSHHPEWR